jgi:hypothetical protein
MLWTIMQKIISAAVFQNKFLEISPGHGHQQAEYLDEIAFPRAIGADDDVEIAQFKIPQLTNRFEAADADVADCSCHEDIRAG